SRRRRHTRSKRDWSSDVCSSDLPLEAQWDADAYVGMHPIYEEMPGWHESTVGAKTLEELPANARAYIKRLEELTGAPVDIVSTGPDRNETIVLRHPFDA